MPASPCELLLFGAGDIGLKDETIYDFRFSILDLRLKCFATDYPDCHGLILQNNLCEFVAKIL